MSDRVMTRADAFLALCLARFREFYRESEVVFWSFIFPIVLSVGLGIAFRNRPVEVLPVAVLQGQGQDSVFNALRGVPQLKVMSLPAPEAERALRMGRVAVVVAPRPGGVDYRLDPSRPESMLARARVDDALQRTAGRTDPVPVRDEPMNEPGGRYIDFLIPGIIGMNLLSGGMWGVGFNLVDMRIKRLLKRLLATPMRRADFMAVALLMRVAFMFIEVTFLLTFARIAFGVPLRGSWGAVFLVGGLGALCFASMGLLVGSRAQRIEGVMGIMNVVTMPMIVCSGVFFSWERFPEAVQPLIRLLPLTALNDALRAVILEGATLASQAAPLGLLALWGGLSFAIGLRLFRWT
jgi:ABC-type multidrug transport system permease subunit